MPKNPPMLVVAVSQLVRENQKTASRIHTAPATMGPMRVERIGADSTRDSGLVIVGLLTVQTLLYILAAFV